MRLAVLVALALAVMSSRSARADVQAWSAVFAQARAGAGDGVTAWFDGHARRRADGMLWLIRPGLGYTVSPRLAVHAGYAWIPLITDEGGNRTEHRIWQQAIVTQPVGDAVKLQARARLEQRFGSGDDIGHRVRVFARGQWQPVPAVNVQLVAWDELFLGLGETDWGTPSGYDQNRLFVGIGSDTKLRGVRVEAGYLNVVLRSNTQVDHVVAVNLFVTLAP